MGVEFRTHTCKPKKVDSKIAHVASSARSQLNSGTLPGRAVLLAAPASGMQGHGWSRGIVRN